MTDDDVTVDRMWLAEVKKTFDEFDCVGVAGKVIAVWRSAKPHWLTDTGQYRLSNAVVSFDQGGKSCELSVSPPGANLSFRKAAFERYGLFRTDLGRRKGLLLNRADTEFFQRVISAGERVVYNPKAVIYHPVDEARTRKSYYRSWCFQDGRSHARTDILPENTIRYFGVPRYLLRSVLQAAVSWVTPGDPKQRFYYELEMWRLVGQILETHRMSKQPVPTLPPV
jgi:glucosyl-dolichyl phosphate glucuronosyltransferase